MAIQPIDLQVLFSRLNQIGREQAAQRNSIVQAQAVAASEIAERSEEEDRRVSETSTEEEGPEKIADDTENQQSGTGGEREEPGHEPTGDTREIVHDPDLGQNIDISG